MKSKKLNEVEMERIYGGRCHEVACAALCKCDGDDSWIRAHQNMNNVEFMRLDNNFKDGE